MFELCLSKYFLVISFSCEFFAEALFDLLVPLVEVFDSFLLVDGFGELELFNLIGFDLKKILLIQVEEISDEFILLFGDYFHEGEEVDLVFFKGIVPRILIHGGHNQVHEHFYHEKVKLVQDSDLFFLSKTFLLGLQQQTNTDAFVNQFLKLLPILLLIRLAFF